MFGKKFLGVPLGKKTPLNLGKRNPKPNKGKSSGTPNGRKSKNKPINGEGSQFLRPNPLIKAQFQPQKPLGRVIKGKNFEGRRTLV